MIKGALTSLVIVLALGVVGNMDYEDALMEEDHYCEMVKTGAWPPYKGGCTKVTGSEAYLEKSSKGHPIERGNLAPQQPVALRRLP